METLRNFVRTLGPVRLAVLGGVALALIGFFVWIIARVTTPPQALLYSDLDMVEAGKITSQLESSGVPFTLGNGGTAIFVASDQVARMRVALAEQGLPSGGSVGYELFDHADPLGATSFQQDITLVRALEGELSRTIRAISTVKAARVHLVLPKREVFSREKAEPTASVLLQMRGGARLTPSQVVAVQHLIASAVPGLKPEHISIVDDQGTLLSTETGPGDDVSAAGTEADRRRRELESRLATTVERLVERTVGAGKVRAEVTVDMDFDRVNTSEEVYDPEGQVVRSTQTVEQASSNADGATPPVSVSTNLPDANAAQGGDGSSTSSKEKRTEETVNYEISKKVINHVREAGTVKRLSVAVLVDGTYDTGADGKRTYQPRSAEEVDKLTNLVRSAVGYNAERGDKVEVVTMQFAQPDLPGEESLDLMFGLEKNDLLRIAEYLALFVLALLVLLLVIKPVVTRAIEALPPAQLAGALPGTALAGMAGPAGLVGGPDQAQAAIAGPAGTAMALPGPGQGGEVEEMIDIDRVEGRVRASALKRVGEIIEKHPDETMQIIRSWLHADD